MDVDPISVVVIGSRISEIQRVMKYRLFHTGYSTILRESFDGSSGVTDRNGQFVGAEGMSFHTTPYAQTVRSVLSHYVPNEMNENDTFIVNDPYHGGSPHAPDMAAVTPVFHEGALVAFATSIAHKPDIGGLVPGSSGAGSRSIYHEGLMLPPVRLFEAGEINREVEAIMRNNSRTPEILMGDVMGQVGCTRIGAQMIQRLCSEYTPEAVMGTFDQMIQSTERRIRAALSEWPDGTAEAVNYLDHNGQDLSSPVKVALTITKRGDNITLDFSNSDGAAVGPVNIRPHVVESVSILALISFIDPTIGLTEGARKAINIINPEGLVTNPRRPSPVNHYVPAAHLVYTNVIECLSQFQPHKAVGGSGMGMGAVTFGYSQLRSGKTYVQYELPSTAMGGSLESDGAHMTAPMVNFTPLQPIEILETEFPVRVLNFGVVQDSGGPGENRGGYSYTRSYRVHSPCLLTLRSSQHKTSAKGIRGGKGPNPTSAIHRSGSNYERSLPSLDTVELQAGDVVQFDYSGGGGYGNPYDRDSQKVLDDVLDGYVSRQKATDDYRVVLINGHSGQAHLSIDEVATAKLRGVSNDEAAQSGIAD